MTELGPRQLSGLEVAAAWAAWTLPVLMGVGSVAVGSSWASDLESVRDVAFIPAGSEGALSSLLSQLAGLLPVGGRVLRGSWLGLVALGACSGLFFDAIRRRLDAELQSSMNAVWALLASQIWASSPLVQAEATRLGGSALGLALVLAGIRLLDELGADRRVDALSGGLVAMTFAQSHVAGVALFACYVVCSFLRQPRGRGPRLGDFGVGLTLVLAIFLGWRFMRTLAPGTSLDLGWAAVPSAFSSDEAAPRGMSELATGVLSEHVARLGSVPLLLAIGGGLACVFRSESRRGLAPFALLALLGLLAGVFEIERARAFFAFAASLGMMAFAALALRLSMRELWRQRVPLARPAAVLGSVFVMALVLSRMEGRQALGAGRLSGAELWTEQALSALPANALLVVDTPSLALRLLSVRAIQGERPDVVIVPTALLARGSLQTRLGRSHPELAPLLRQLAVSGAADEYTLSQLADHGPVFLELNPGWDRRLLEHLRPDGLWLAAAPHALGALDRRAGAASSRAALWRVIQPLAAASALDAGTRSALAELEGQQALLLAALGERESAREVLRIRGTLGARDNLATELASRLAERERGAVAIADLLD